MLDRRQFLAVLLAPSLASCRSAGAGKGSLPSGLDLASLDRAVRPQDDLYRFAAGTWLPDTPIPPDRSNYGAFGVLQDEVHADVRAIAETAAASPVPAGSDAQRLGDLYLSFMDTARIEAVGLEPLRPELARIEGIDSREALLACMGHFQTLAVRARSRSTSTSIPIGRTATSRPSGRRGSPFQTASTISRTPRGMRSIAAGTTLTWPISRGWPASST